MKRMATGGGWRQVAAMVGWPVLWGGAAASLFYAALYRGSIHLPLLERYCTGHPISVAEVVLFFVGLAALLVKSSELFRQTIYTRQLPLEPAGTESEEPEQAGRWMELLESDPGGLQRSWLAQRVYSGLAHVARTGVGGLEDTLHRLAAKAEERQHESYSLVRIVIWAIPMLGFLGTVIGIARALGGLDPEQLATAPAQAMQGLLAGLYVAFDTTALALTLSIALMFLQFPVERIESQLLEQIGQRTAELLVGRFAGSGSYQDPQLAAMERMSYAVIRTAENLVKRQAELWQASFEEVRQAWRQHWDRAGATLQQALASALDSVLGQHREELAQLEKDVAEKTAAQWQAWLVELHQNQRLLQQQLESAQQQLALLERLTTATGDLLRLEDALNANLEQLAGAKHFEETVMSLAAAIQLLTARLQPPHELRRVELRPGSRPEERAA
ncbi:MAG: hypothetical protein KatS3mg110_3257 [Pirellulaceae bacterium]|nr:MAG: hypothetical protein KatS3mg110_3257 [Pirellulaceae bacterium]